MDAAVMPLPAASGLHGPRVQVVGADTRVPLRNGTLRTYINLDNAASTPVLRSVLDDVNRFMGWYSSVHRGTGFKSRVATRAYEDAREIVAGFVGANLGDHVVVFGKNATEALNKLSYRLPLADGDVVLVSMLEHHSNDLPWRARARVEHIACDEQGGLDEDDLDRLLALHAGRVKLVAVTGAANVTGALPDIHRIARKAHAAGARILVDGAQRVPHRRVEMGTPGDPSCIDYLTLSAHKMYAPFGTGALIGRRDTFEQGAPEHCGGGTITHVGLDSVDWAAAPERDEAGTPNVVGAVALASAIQALLAIGMGSVAAHEAALTRHALQSLAGVPGLRVHGDRDPARAAERLGVIPFELSDRPHALVAAMLGADHGIGVRSGCFCAQPYLAQLLGLGRDDVRRVRDGLRAGDHAAAPGLVRISFGIYNTLHDIDVLVHALKEIAAGLHVGDFRLDRASGEYVARGWQPALENFFRLGAGAPPQRGQA